MPDDCPHIDDCAMYKLLRLAGTLKTWQTRYCCAEYTECARYRRSAQGLPVAQNLMPNGSSLKVAARR